MSRRILFIDVSNNGCMVKLPSLFHQQGMNCLALSWDGDLLFKSSYLKRKYGVRDNEGQVHLSDLVQQTAFSLHHSNTDFLITNEEQVIHKYLEICEAIKARGPQNDKERKFIEVVAASLVTDKSLLLRPYSQDMAKKAGFPIPAHMPITSTEALVDVLETYPRPFYLKISVSVGGQGVFKIEENDKREWIDHALSQFSPPSITRPYLAQTPVDGDEVTISFAAYKGHLLGYTVARPLLTVVQRGASSYIETLYRPQLESTLTNFCKLTSFNGFGGFDAIETAGNRLPTVIEANMRLTHTVPACRQQGTDLVKLLCEAIKGKGITNHIPVHQQSTAKIALYPEEAMRLPESPNLENGLVSAPWSDPGAMRGLSHYIKRNIEYPPRSLEERYKIENEAK